jgi:hypothetical protein
VATQAAAMAADSSSTSSTGEPPACQLLLLPPEKPAQAAGPAAALPKIKLPGLRAKKKPAAAAVTAAAAGAAGPQTATSPALSHRQPGGMPAAEPMPSPAAPAVPAAAAVRPAAAPAVPAGTAAAAPTGWRVQRLPAVLPEDLPTASQARCLPHAAQLLCKWVRASDGCTPLPLLEQTQPMWVLNQLQTNSVTAMPCAPLPTHPRNQATCPACLCRLQR